MVIYIWFCSGRSDVWADWDLSLPYINYQLSNYQVKVILQCQQKNSSTCIQMIQCLIAFIAISKIIKLLLGSQVLGIYQPWPHEA